MKSRKTIRIKAIAAPAPCIFRGVCQGDCEWCETHSYSEACVPMLQQRVQALYTLEEIAHKLCSHFGHDECAEATCPAFNRCYRGHNGMLDLLREVVQ